MIKFGPSGTCEDFTAHGYKHSAEAAQWVRSNDLDCFEYSFGRGINLRDETAVQIGEAFRCVDVEMSVHAPYYINLATPEEIKAENSFGYIMNSLHMLRKFGGARCVFHPGSPLKQDRSAAMKLLLQRFEHVLRLKNEMDFDDLLLCPETMGKKAQLGDLEEIIQMCRMGDDTIVPCIDWGHLNSRDCGVFFGYDDYKRVVDRLIDTIGAQKTARMHVHFSKIQYTNGGELRHLTFEDEIYGPQFEPLLRVYEDYRMSPYIVCESAGTQTRDARAMKDFYRSIHKETAD